jgi:group I intron endonuclease
MHIYAITNTVNDKIYVGQHAGDLPAYLLLNFRRAVSSDRWNDKPVLYRAIRKYGPEAFVIRSLVVASDKQQVNELERFFIRTLDARDPEIGYNLAEGGTGGATRTGYKNSPEHVLRARLGITGKPKSPEHRKNLSLAKTGVPNPSIAESNIRRRMKIPTLAALRNRRYRANKKAKEATCLMSQP